MGRQSPICDAINNRLACAWASISLVGVCLIASERCAGEDSPLLYESDIAPLIEDRCAHCHGDGETEAGLDLSSPQGLTAGSESGPVVTPGDVNASLLYTRVHEGEMPPEEEGSLSESEIDRIRLWIEGGARFRDPGVSLDVIDQHRIIPLMLLRCAACHGASKQEAGLDLRTVESMLNGGDSGPAIVSGDPDASLIVQRIRAEQMPPRRRLVEASVKPMEAGELKLLEEWIRRGLPVSESDATARSSVTDTDRRFWSFQPPVRTVVPAVKDRERVGNPIDAFIIERLEQRGLSLSPEADRATLIRRVTFDLTGLPPHPHDVRRFLEDDDPHAYEKLVDQLLASPHYGPRWGRHWLDAAGYADSEGAQNEDRVRDHLWRYRDYVIRAFNADKPYDEFLTQQLAGDELADYENADVIDAKLYDNLVATGFLRTAPDRTFAPITNFVPDRLEVIADEIQIIGSSLLGLTINCARCHAHKFDPISQVDYYRLAAVLKDAYDEHDWLPSQGPRTLPYVTTAEREAWEQHEQPINEQIAALENQREATEDPAEHARIDEEIKALEAGRLPEPRIAALWSRGRPSPTYVLLRGNYLTPGAPVAPGVPAVLAMDETEYNPKPPSPGASQTGRRLAFARWITQPDHPLTARVMVNRIWRHHFGTGLVSTLDNFGITGERPSHPELLDWLAVEFVERGWSIKDMHRLLVTSNTYRQSSLITPEREAADAEGRLLSRMPLSRMEAEVVRDSLLTLAGRLEDRMFGSPDPVEVRDDGLVTPARSGAGSRRSIFILQRRTQTPTLLDNFDFPQMGPNCTSRRTAVVATQALHLLNDATIHELAQAFAARIRELAGTSPSQQIEQVYLVALSRRPAADELDAGVAMLAE